MTQPITISISHELGAEEAKRRIANGFGRMVQQLPGGALMQMQERWEGDRIAEEQFFYDTASAWRTV